MKFENRDAGTARRSRRPEKLKITCLQGMQVSGRGVQGRGRAESHQTQGRKELDGSKIPVLFWDFCFLGARNQKNEAEVEQRGDSPVLVMHNGPKGVDFPSCEKVVKSTIKDLDNFGCHRVVFWCDHELSILALLRAVTLAWTGVVLQETSAESDP